MYSYEIEQLIAEEIINNIENFEGSYASDLAYDMNNNDYYIIGTYQAKEFLKEYFDDMLECLEEYEAEMGECYKYITNTERVATLLALEVAKEVLSNSKTIDEVWNEELEEEHILQIKEELKKYYSI